MLFQYNRHYIVHHHGPSGIYGFRDRYQMILLQNPHPHFLAHNLHQHIHRIQPVVVVVNILVLVADNILVIEPLDNMLHLAHFDCNTFLLRPRILVEPPAQK